MFFIREFGFKIPCLVRSDGEVVDGHLRLKAALKLGIPEVPVILCDEWTPAQVKAFRLLVNRSVNWADWDDELLTLELEDLKGLDFDLSLTRARHPRAASVAPTRRRREGRLHPASSRRCHGEAILTRNSGVHDFEQNR